LSDNQTSDAAVLRVVLCALGEPIVELSMLSPGSYVPLANDPIRYYRVPILGRLYRARVARCVDMLPPGRRVLEIGYGSGVAFLNLAQRFSEIHGIDLHERGDEVARSFECAGLRPQLRRGDVRELPYPDGHFDAALAISIHEHLQPGDQIPALREIARVLKPGGVYVVGVPGRNALMGAGFRLLGYDMRQIHPSSETDVLDAVGQVLDVEEVRTRRLLGSTGPTMYVAMRARRRAAACA
jgi:SAM-dependent methyltransferase